jgi:predicted O-linked N-acetylglucosamine transferase (SPINDLY family)
MGAPEILRQVHALAAAGNLADAIRVCSDGTLRFPRDLPLCLTLGILQHQAGHIAAALDCFDKAHALDPRNVDVWYCLAGALKAAGRSTDAIAAYRKTLDFAPDFFQAADNLGNLLLENRQVPSAHALFERSIAINPKNPRAFNGCGLACRAMGRIGEAIGLLRRAIELHPDYVEAWSNLGNALRDAGNIDESMAAHRQAIRRAPQRAEPHMELGITLTQLKRNREAIAEYRTAIGLNPALAPAHANLGATLLAQGDLDAATGCLRDALRLDPDLDGAHSNYLFALHYRPDIDATKTFRIARDYQARFAAPLAAAMRPHVNSRDPQRRLRIGYLSADLRQHPLGFFLEPVLESHDRAGFEVTCYSGVVTPDAVTERLRAKSDRWVDALAYSDDDLAEKIRTDGIDILVDLSGHTAGHRLLVMARKPAPIQATWMGYLDGTGLDAIDYLITDEWTAPAAEGGRYFSETLWRLPEVYQCYRAPSYAPPVGPAPCTCTGAVTFGCLNNLSKVNEAVVETWSAILDAAPGSRMLLKTNNLDDAPTLERTRERFASYGIAPDRLLLEGGSPHAEFLAAYRRVDIALDPFPYSGGLSTCEALWMGVPVVKLLDRRFLSRFGASFLAATGLECLLAETREDYIRIAAKLASDPARLLGLRSGLRERMAASTLCRGEIFTPQLETAYRTWWQRWCGVT